MRPTMTVDRAMIDSCGFTPAELEVQIGQCFSELACYSACSPEGTLGSVRSQPRTSNAESEPKV